jgi:hypothetical protein
MKNYSYVVVYLAMLVITLTLGAVPCRAQVPVTPANVTQVRLVCTPSSTFCVHYDKVASASWIERRSDGTKFNFVEDKHDATTVFLSDASRNVKMQFDLSRMMMGGSEEDRSHIAQGQLSMSSFRGEIAYVYGVSKDDSPDTCKQQNGVGVKCTCDLGSLRPLQGAVGLEEVYKKRDDISSGKKTRFDLAFDPIKIVRGFDGLLFVTDHHHGARAWLESGATMGTCVVQSETISTDPTKFWTDLNALNLVRLKNEKGEDITEKQLPTKLRDLPDDPYRTLAWMVRKKDGFCRALMQGNTEFAEFKWADWMRARPELPYAKVKANPKAMRDSALKLAKSPDAAGLPGYRGDKPANYTCPPDPD